MMVYCHHIVDAFKRNYWKIDQIQSAHWILLMKQVLVGPTALYKKEEKASSTWGVEFYLLVLVIGALPLERLILPAALKIVDLPLVLLIGYGCLLFMIRRQVIKLPLVWPVWLSFVASLIATLTGLLSSISIVAMVQEVYLFIWFIVLTNILINISQADFDFLLRIWCVIAVIEATTAIMGMLHIGPAIFYTSPTKGNILSTGEFNRGFGTFANPNATGAYLSISFFILLANKGLTKWTRFILGSYLILGIYSTGSMGAVLSTCVSGAILGIISLVHTNRQRAFLTVGLAAIAISALLILILTYNPLQSLASLTDKNSENQLLMLTLGRLPHSVSGRVNLVEDVWPLFTRYPFGIGPNAAVLISGTLHNDYIAYLLERGPLGLIAWLWLVLATLIIPLRMTIKARGSLQYWQFLALWAAFLALVLNAFSHEISHFRQVWVLMALLYGLYYNLSTHKDKSLAFLEAQETSS
jgi:hypothetical protein